MVTEGEQETRKVTMTIKSSTVFIGVDFGFRK